MPWNQQKIDEVSYFNMVKGWKFPKQILLTKRAVLVIHWIKSFWNANFENLIFKKDEIKKLSYTKFKIYYLNNNRFSIWCIQYEVNFKHVAPCSRISNGNFE